jgi:hypothetical protein
VADKGYYNGDELRECEQNDIIAYVAKPKTSPNKAKGYFDRSRFTYIKQDDEYACPVGERLTYRTTTTDGGKTIRRYWASACGSCVLKSQCTNGKERRVSRWVHEDVLERAAKRLRRKPEVMLARRSPSVRHAEVVDQRKSLPDEAIIGGEYRNQPADPGLQHETSDQPGRNKKNH